MGVRACLSLAAALLGVAVSCCGDPTGIKRRVTAEALELSRVT